MSALGQKRTCAAHSACPLCANSGQEGAACFGSGRRRVTGEDVVAVFGRLVTGEASFVQCLVARFAILEVGKSPAASLRVLL